MIKEINLIFSAIFLLFFSIYLVSAADCGGETPCSCGDTIIESYIMTENLACESGNGLVFAANNTRLDCNGSSISTSNYGANNGITTQEYLNNLTINNCTISNFGNGIVMDHASNVTITNISSYNNAYNGIYLYYTSGILYLSKINAYNNSEIGIYYLDDMDDFTVNLTIVSSSTFNNTYSGIHIQQNFNGDTVDNFKVFINNVSSYSNGYSGIVLGNAITEINNSRIYNNTYNGINAGTDDDEDVYNKLRVTNSNISNNGQDGIFARKLETDASYNLTNNYICGNLGAGGQVDSSCPFIYGYNGKDYQFINDAFPLGKLWFLEEVPWIVKILVKIGILNEVPGIRDTTYTKIPFDLEATNNQYDLRIREQYDERSYFDSIELMVIDHEPGIEVYPDRYSDSIITTSKNLISPISCVDNYGNNCLSLISSLDENVQKLKKNDYIIIDFGDLSSAEKIKLVLAKGAVGAQNVKKFEVLDKKGNWVEANYKLGNIVNLNGFATTPNVFDMTGLFLTNDHKIKIHAEDIPFLNREFDERLVINFMAIDTSKQEENIKITTLKPTSAQLISSSIEGFWSEIKVFEGNGYSLPRYSSTKNLIQYEDVTDKLQGDECNFVNVKNCDKQVIMEFGDEFSVKYNVPILDNGKERDFIVITNGAYEKLPSSGHTDVFVSMGYILSGENNTCDTTWNYNDSDVSGCTNTCGLTYFAGGDGSASNPYQIETCQQLQYTTYFLNANYTLTGNINCSNTTNWNYDNYYENVYRGFVPIGSGHNDAETNSVPFTGTFNGNNYNITDLYINSYYTSMSNHNYIGLFGIIGSGAVVKDLGLVNVNISGGNQYDSMGGTGGLAGYSTGDSTINNTFTTGIVGGDYYVGGLVGSHAYDPGTCFAAGTKILLSDGNYKNIEDIKVGDNVKSYNEISKEKIKGEVVKIFKHTTDSYLIINNKLKVTPNHPMYVNGDWKQAGEIKIGDNLFNENNNLIRINSIIHINNPIEVYNFEVESNVESEEFCGPGHSYYAQGFLAHNKCPRVYTNNGTDYLFDSLLSVYHIGKHQDGIFNYTLKNFNSPIIRVDYDENEINYLDMIEIHSIDTSLTNSQNKTQILKPISCTPADKCDLNLISNIDKNYLILDENNKQIFLDFGSIPETEPDYTRTYLIVSKGYSDIIYPFKISDFPDYIQKWLREYNKYLHPGEKHHTIMNSYSTCNVTGTTNYIGGLVGRNDGTVNNSYATGIISGDDDIGGLVGYSVGNISDSYATGNVNATGESVGGFIGENYGTINNSYAVGTVNGTTYVGGFTGRNYGSIYFSYSTGNISGQEDIGGLSGYNANDGEGYPGLIERSYATGIVNATIYKAGGLIGYNDGNVSNSYSRGNVFSLKGGMGETDSFAGGLVGVNNAGNITDSYSSGNIIATGDYVGGLVGQNSEGIINNSYSTGNVTYDGSNIGGLVGNNGGTIENSYWYDISQGISCYSGGNTGCTAKTTLSYFYTITNPPMDSWNFTSTWDNVNNGINYPPLRWQEASASNSVNANANANTNPQSSSGGGYAPQVYEISNPDLTTGYERDLRINDKYQFQVETENHTLTMNYFNSTTARVIIQSNPIIVYLNKDEEKQVDINNDNIQDIRLIYRGTIQERKAKVLIEEINKVNEILDREEIKEKEIKEYPISKEELTKNKSLFIIQIALVFAAAIVAILIIRIRKKRHRN